MMNIDTVRYWGACKAEAISKRDSSLTLGTSSAIPIKELSMVNTAVSV